MFLSTSPGGASKASGARTAREVRSCRQPRAIAPFYNNTTVGLRDLLKMGTPAYKCIDLVARQHKAVDVQVLRDPRRVRRLM